MADQDRLQEVQQDIKAVLGQILETQTSLAAAEEAEDMDKVNVCEAG
jgi:hypothetical protein